MTVLARTTVCVLYPTTLLQWIIASWPKWSLTNYVDTCSALHRFRDFFLHYILDATMFRRNKHNPRGFITCVWINVKTSINTLRYLHHRLLRGKCEMFTSWILISGSRDNIYGQTRLKLDTTVTSVTFCFEMSQLHLFQHDLNSRLRRWIFWSALLDWHIWTDVPFMMCYGFSIDHLHHQRLHNLQNFCSPSSEDASKSSLTTFQHLLIELELGIIFI